MHVDLKIILLRMITLFLTKLHMNSCNLNNADLSLHLIKVTMTVTKIQPQRITELYIVITRHVHAFCLDKRSLSLLDRNMMEFRCSHPWKLLQYLPKYLHLEHVSFAEMEDFLYSDTALYCRSVILGTITITGIIANTISLTFFLRYVLNVFPLKLIEYRG